MMKFCDNTQRERLPRPWFSRFLTYQVQHGIDHLPVRDLSDLDQPDQDGELEIVRHRHFDHLFRPFDFAKGRPRKVRRHSACQPRWFQHFLATAEYKVYIFLLLLLRPRWNNSSADLQLWLTHNTHVFWSTLTDRNTLSLFRRTTPCFSPGKLSNDIQHRFPDTFLDTESLLFLPKRGRSSSNLQSTSSLSDLPLGRSHYGCWKWSRTFLGITHLNWITLWPETLLLQRCCCCWFTTFFHTHTHSHSRLAARIDRRNDSWASQRVARFICDFRSWAFLVW